MQFLDAETRRQIDFDQVWSQITPVSPLGRDLMRKTTAFKPEQASELKADLNRLDLLSSRLKPDPKIITELEFLLSTTRDIGGSLKRSLQGVILDDMEFYEIKKLLTVTGKIQEELIKLNWQDILPQHLDVCSECLESLSLGQGSYDSFYIADAYDEQLAKIRQKRVFLESSLANLRTEIDNKLLGAVGRILSMDGDIAVSTTNIEAIARLEAMPELTMVQETVNFITFRLVEDEVSQKHRQTLKELREQEEKLKHKIRGDLTETIANFAPRLAKILEQLAFLDFLLAKARFAVEIGGIKPEISPLPIISIKKGKHLVVEEEVSKAGHNYTPLCLEISAGVTLITGPNMGGKTASLKTIGLLIAMAQYGLLVPVSAMKFNPRIFIRAHLAAAEIPKGLSSFAGEVSFLRDVIEQSDADGLILVDEIAHGTNPVEGASIAQAMLEYLHEKTAISVITTHFPSLARLKKVNHLRVRGLDKEKLKEAKEFSLQSCMDYSLVATSPAKQIESDAAVVAEALGLDSTIIQRAKELLELEKREHING